MNFLFLYYKYFGISSFRVTPKTPKIALPFWRVHGMFTYPARSLSPRLLILPFLKRGTVQGKCKQCEGCKRNLEGISGSGISVRKQSTVLL